MKLTRLDDLMVERKLAPNAQAARALVLSGEVFSGDRRLEKAGERIRLTTEIQIRSRRPPFVSRGGLKLDAALGHFKVLPIGRYCLDIGSSTGGFTDCLLIHGASHVVSVDVGYGIIDSRLRNDSRVTLLERTNARHLRPEQLDLQISTRPTLAVIDVSFISLGHVVEAVHRSFGELEWVCLFKPQFEVGPKFVLKGGRVENHNEILRALEGTHLELLRLGLHRLHDPLESPVVGKKGGNVEYLLHYGPKTDSQTCTPS